MTLATALLTAACATQQTSVASTAPAMKAAPAAVAYAEPEPAVDAQAEQEWQTFLAAREHYLASLGKPLLACTNRDNDKKHAGFATCTSYDWQSMLQSAYALNRLSRLTGDPTYSAAADVAIDKKVLRAVGKALSQDGAASDPYAYTWILAAAGSTTRPSAELSAMANRVAAQLEQWLGSMREEEMVRGVMIGAPNSVAWVAQNLWQWGTGSGDTALAGRMLEFTETRLATSDYDEWCSLTVDEQPESNELFPPCLHRVLAVLTVMPEDKSGKWLQTFLPDETSIEPLSQAGWSTHAALNFSRSWGLWALYTATGDIRWRDRYVDHVTTQMDPAMWTALDEADRPWIAQFGVLAIDLSFDVVPNANTLLAAPGGTAAAPQ